MHLLSLDSEEEIRKGVADAVEPPDSSKSSEAMEDDLDYLSSAPIQLAAVLSRWKTEQTRSGFVSDLDGPISLEKLDRLMHILGPFLQKY